VNPTVILQAIPVVDLRKQLENMFHDLDLVHAEISVVSEAAGSGGRGEIANVLSLCVANRLFNQLKLLAVLIRQLGGSTNLSELLDKGPTDRLVAVTPAKSTPDKNSLKDPFLTNHELQRVLRKGYTQEKTLSGTIVYCRKEVRLGTFIPKQHCVTGTQLMGWPMIPITPIPIP
jgi:hypothetical protein